MSARISAAQFHEAIDAYQAISAWDGSWIPLRLGDWGPKEVMWRQGPGSDLPELVRWLDERHDDEVLLGVPQRKPFNGGVGSASMLWLRVEGDAQLERARKLRPLPSMAFQEGTTSRRWLYWSLETVVDYFTLKAANRKLAYATGGKQRWGDPDVPWFPCPGTCLRTGRSRPVPVRVARLTTVSYPDAEAVVGRLKEPPELKPFWEL